MHDAYKYISILKNLTNNLNTLIYYSLLKNIIYLISKGGIQVGAEFWKNATQITGGFIKFDFTSSILFTGRRFTLQQFLFSLDWPSASFACRHRAQGLIYLFIIYLFLNLFN